MAQIYKWTDENGEVQFGDKPPQGREPAALSVMPERTRTATFQGKLDTKQVSTGKPIINLKTTSLLKVKLQKVAVSLNGNASGRMIIGRSYHTPGCDKNQSSPIYSDNEGVLQNRGFFKEFARVLQANNYLVVMPSTALFEAANDEQEDLLVGAVLKELNVNICQRKDRKMDVASYVKVQWQVFDPLDKEVIFETTSEGSDQITLESNAMEEAKETDARSFANATINLLAQPNFIKALAVRDDVISAKDTKPVSLQLSYGRGSGDFLKQVEQLKAATVTVRSARGHGSGLIVSSDGYVVTNAHVVGRSSEVVILVNDKKHRAHLIKEDAKRDVALLKMDAATALPVLTLSSKKANTGENVFVIGTPLDENLSHTVTKGIISAERLVEGQRFYQTDAAVNPGNSGGPAFDNSGEVIGITVSGLFAKGGGSMNINFLIPISEVVESLGLD